ncbi:methionyl-tRNA formyltransferase [Salinibacter ruber]|uniref:methionyl-tRNA formyltransferase n=1 Tax=Salinibacter ruber TaxID=146919 RepID=UPI000E56FDA0|nr:formyltransferase family protein [Salinibacter ruber]MCS3705873.1 methionyl-tRNA formyltransferase [Salinibacter ruber]
MKVLYMGNNWLGLKVLEWLTGTDDEVVGLVLHPKDSATCAEQMREEVDLPTSQIFDGAKLRDKETEEAIRVLEPDVGVSVLLGYILQPSFLDIFPEGAVNLHPAYLPYNRGAYPNVWSIVNGTPAGVTLHEIDEGVDTGDIWARRRVEVRPSDTGRSLYRRLEQAGLDLFRTVWPKRTNGELTPVEQSEDEGTKNYTSDVEEIDEIDLDATYTGRELINILRARTFPPYDGAYFEEDGQKVYLRLELTE